MFLFEVQTICAPKFMIREISGGNIPLSDCKSSSIFVWAGILKLHVYMPSEVKDVVSALCIISLVNGSLSSARISITAVLNSLYYRENIWQIKNEMNSYWNYQDC